MKQPLCQGCGKELLSVCKTDLIRWEGLYCPTCHRYYNRGDTGAW